MFSNIFKGARSGQPGAGGVKGVSHKNAPIADHPYHQKTTQELQYIMADANEAAKNMKGMNDAAESKYLDQVNDASTVLGYRKRNNLSDADAIAAAKKNAMPKLPKAQSKKDWMDAQRRALSNSLSTGSKKNEGWRGFFGI